MRKYNKGKFKRQMHVRATFSSKSVDAFSFTTESVAEGIRELNTRFSSLIRVHEPRQVGKDQDAYTEESDSFQESE